MPRKAEESREQKELDHEPITEYRITCGSSSILHAMRYLP
jgi:hypothetical protein